MKTKMEVTHRDKEAPSSTLIWCRQRRRGEWGERRGGMCVYYKGWGRRVGEEGGCNLVSNSFDALFTCSVKKNIRSTHFELNTLQCGT